MLKGLGDAFDAHHPERDDARGSGGVVGMIWAVFDAAWYKRGHVSTREAGQLLKIGAATDFALCSAELMTRVSFAQMIRRGVWSR